MRPVPALGLLAPLLLAAACGLRPPAWERPPAPASDPPVVPQGALHRAALDNGLRAIVLEDPRLPRLVLGVALRRGGAVEPPASAGLAAFTAEVMKRGAGPRDARALARAVDALGASLSVGSGWDSMEVSVSGLSRDEDRLFEILADVVLRPTFPEDEAGKARDETLARLQRALDSPGTLLHWNLLRTLYGEHRYGLPRVGTPESVATFDARRAREFHRALFVANNAVFSASGDLEVGRVLERVRALFGAWEAGAVPEPHAPPPERVPPARRVVVVDRPELAQAHIALAHEGLRRTDPDRIAAGLLNSVVGGGGFSSRLMQVVRSDAGLTYSVDSSLVLRRDAGLFEVSTFTAAPQTRRVLDLVLGELERARREPPGPDELEAVRSRVVGGFSMGLETSDAVIGGLVDLELYGLPEDGLDTYRARVRATDAGEVATMARRLLHPERAAIAVVGPALQIVPQLEGLGPVQVVEPVPPQPR